MMKKNVVSTVIITAVIAMSSVAWADDFDEDEVVKQAESVEQTEQTEQTGTSDKSRTAGTGPNPFSDCGIGAALFPTVPFAAVTSNIIWDIGTTALTSATASPETCTGRSLQAAIFINDTYESLAEEAAQGQGDHLITLLNIFECNTDTQQEVIGNVRLNMGINVSSSSYDVLTHTQKASAFYDIVSNVVATKCSA